MSFSRSTAIRVASWCSSTPYAWSSSLSCSDGGDASCTAHRAEKIFRVHIDPYYTRTCLCRKGLDAYLHPVVVIVLVA